MDATGVSRRALIPAVKRAIRGVTHAIVSSRRPADQWTVNVCRVPLRTIEIHGAQAHPTHSPPRLATLEAEQSLVQAQRAAAEKGEGEHRDQEREGEVGAADKAFLEKISPGCDEHNKSLGERYPMRQQPNNQHPPADEFDRADNDSQSIGERKPQARDALA